MYLGDRDEREYRALRRLLRGGQGKFRARNAGTNQENRFPPDKSSLLRWRECHRGKWGGWGVWEVLFGCNNHAGRLMLMFTRHIGQLPVYYNHFPSKRNGYVEGNAEPLFVFGHGLSYTTFKYDGLTVSVP